MLLILQHTPSWVWGVLVLLLALALWQNRSRYVARRTLLLTPGIILVFAAYGVASVFGHTPTAWGCWLLGLLLPLLLWPLLPAIPSVYQRADGYIHIPGSHWPGLWLLAVFLIRYIMGVAAARNWPQMQTVHFIAVSSGSLGLLAGLFILRSLRIARSA